jgi:hypothetical protein
VLICGIILLSIIVNISESESVVNDKLIDPNLFINSFNSAEILFLLVIGVVLLSTNKLAESRSSVII